MKKFVATSLLALCAIALAQSEASAWQKFSFGIGLNWNYASGGNSLLWGAWRNGQPPGPEAPYYDPYLGQGHGHHHPQGHGHHHHGYMPQPYYAPAPYAMPFEMPMYEPSYAQPMMPAPQAYQFATYPRPVYYYGR